MANRYTTDAELVAVVPALSSVDAAIRGFALDQAATMISLEAWGEKASFAHVHLAAHFVATHPGSGYTGGGPSVTSRTMGSVSASYAVPQPAAHDSDLSTTAHGRMYLRLRDSLFRPSLGVIGTDEVSQ